MEDLGIITGARIVTRREGAGAGAASGSGVGGADGANEGNSAVPGVVGVVGVVAVYGTVIGASVFVVDGCLVIVEVVNWSSEFSGAVVDEFGVDVDLVGFEGTPLPMNLIDAEASFRGVCGSEFNQHRQLKHINLFEEAEVVARNEAGLRDQIRRPDRRRPEAQMRGRHRARLLRVIHEVALCEIVSLRADDLDHERHAPSG